MTCTHSIFNEFCIFIIFIFYNERKYIECTVNNDLLRDVDAGQNDYHFLTNRCNLSSGSTPWMVSGNSGGQKTPHKYDTGWIPGIGNKAVHLSVLFCPIATPIQH